MRYSDPQEEGISYLHFDDCTRANALSIFKQYPECKCVWTEGLTYKPVSEGFNLVSLNADKSGYVFAMTH